MLATHLRAGVLSTVMPRAMAEELAMPDGIVSIPIVAPDASTLIGLVVAKRDPQTPLTAALVAEARMLAPSLSTMT
ncbi:DNA-binding transcriptional LysR family regulator [Rhodoplanes tepidamans]|nr:DNA-binding transcriptional LysR family regulator [Rhodoplanes tepidamans]